jgi:hypothetical protein
VHLDVATVEVSPVLSPQALHSLQGFRSDADAMVESRDPIHIVLVGCPGGTDPELEPTVGEVVNSSRNLREQSDVPIGDASYLKAHPDARC